MINLYKFLWSVGRGGKVESVFLATPEEVEWIVGKTVSFGEILGKHSDVYGVVEENEIKMLSDDQSLTQKLSEIFPEGTVAGYNPITYRKEYEEENSDEDDSEE